MAVNITLQNLASLQNETSAIAAINANNATIETALTGVLALNGNLTAPNSMNTSLDMNGQAVINLPAPASGDSPLRLQDYNTLVSGGTIYVNNNIGVEYIIDGGGAQLSTGLHGTLTIPFAGTIKSVSLLTDQTGSCVLDIWKTTYASYSPPTHPAVADSITGTSVPTITSGTKYTDSTLTGWSTQINSGDILAFNLNSVNNVTRITVCLTVTKTG